MEPTITIRISDAAEVYRLLCAVRALASAVEALDLTEPQRLVLVPLVAEFRAALDATDSR